MNRKTVYGSAFAAAFAMFAVAGGIQASEKAVKVEEAEHRAVSSQPPGTDATIAFANSGNIRDWHPDGLNALYIEDSHGRCYRATLMGTCVDLQATEQVAFLTQGADTLDKFSAISVRGQRCPFATLETSAGPRAGPLRRSKAKSIAPQPVKG